MYLCVVVGGCCLFFCLCRFCSLIFGVSVQISLVHGDFRLNNNERLIFEANGNFPSANFEWVLSYQQEQDNSDIILSNSMVFITIYDKYCVIDMRLDNENFFQSDTNYTISTTITVSSNDIATTATSNRLSMSMNDAPSNGSCVVSVTGDRDNSTTRNIIYALESLVVVKCSNWEGNDLPLRYHFSIDDGMLYFNIWQLNLYVLFLMTF